MTDERDTSPFTRTGPEERDYLLRRASDHRALAERCDEPGPRLIHQRFQQLYEEQAAAAMMVVPD